MPRLYIALLVLVVYLPIPLGSNRIWAWAPMEIMVFLLAAIWLWAYARGRVEIADVFRKARPVLIVFALWLGFGLFQILPLPHSVIKVLSPNAAELYEKAYLAPALSGKALNAASHRFPSASLRVTLADGGAFPRVSPLITTTGSQTLTPKILMSQDDLAPFPWHSLSLDPGASLAAWLKSCAYVLLFGLTLLLVDSRSRLRTFAYVILFAGLAEAAYGSLRALSEGGVASGTFTNRNHFAAYLVMCLSVGIGLLIASAGEPSIHRSWRNRIRNIAALVLSHKAPVRIFLAIMVMALVLTHSRMGNTAFFAGMLIAGVLALALFKGSSRPVTILIASLVVIDLVIIGSWIGIDRVTQRIAETTLATETRDEVSIHSLEAWRDYPLFGTGAGSYYGVFPRYREADVGGAFFAHAHNDYVEFLTESGLVGTGLLGMATVRSLWSALIAQRKRRDILMRGVGFASTMAIVAMLIHATVEFNLQIPANAATFMLLLAMAWLARHLSQGSPTTILINRQRDL